MSQDEQTIREAEELDGDLALFVEWLEEHPSTGAWGTVGAELVRALAAKERTLRQALDRVDSACEALSDEDAAFIREALAALNRIAEREGHT